MPEIFNRVNNYVWDTGSSEWVKMTQPGTIAGTIADTQIAFGTGADTIGGSADLTWIGGVFVASPSVLGGTAGFYTVNSSNTADSAAELAASTTGDSATGDSFLTLSVHEGGADFAEFGIAVAGDSGNATPTTTFTFPGAALFSASVAGDENLIVFENPTTGGTSQFRVLGGIDGVNEVSLSFRATADTGVSLTQTSTNGPYPFLFVGASTYTFDADITFASASLPATTTTFTDGAAAAVGTLTNAPAAGNPTKWIPIDDNGTTRYIPAW